MNGTSNQCKIKLKMSTTTHCDIYFGGVQGRMGETGEEEKNVTFLSVTRLTQEPLPLGSIEH